MRYDLGFRLSSISHEITLSFIVHDSILHIALDSSSCQNSARLTIAPGFFPETKRAQSFRS